MNKINYLRILTPFLSCVVGVIIINVFISPPSIWAFNLVPIVMGIGLSIHLFFSYREQEKELQ